MMKKFSKAFPPYGAWWRYDLTKCAFFLHELKWKLRAGVLVIGPIALAVIWREREQSTMPAEEEPVFCPAKECQARLPQHHPLCPVSPVEHKVESLKFYFHQYQKVWRQNDVLRQKLNERVTFWQGKCAVLRHENNKLRQKLRDAGLLD